MAKCLCRPKAAGPVAIIPKTLHGKIAKHFRSILLLPNAAKRAHALLRSQIMDKLELSRSPGQLGGFPGQQVLYGSHAIELLARSAMFLV